MDEGEEWIADDREIATGEKGKEEPCLLLLFFFFSWFFNFESCKTICSICLWISTSHLILKRHSLKSQLNDLGHVT